MHHALTEVDHRPWPVPTAPWVMEMSWQRLLFAHWPVSPDVLRPTLPEGLTLDTFEGEAWLGVVPFVMAGVRARGLPRVPGTHEFLELNLRTYVRVADRPGVWFYSLDASSRLAVRGARATFHLPYFDASMEIDGPTGGNVTYRSRRTHRRAPAAELDATYGPASGVSSTRSPLETWLTERYCLYSARPDGSLLCGEVHHVAWPLQPAHAEFRVNSVASSLGLTLNEAPAQLHYAESVDVVAWWPKRVRSL